jgi:hypothetical protein
LNARLGKELAFMESAKYTKSERDTGLPLDQYFKIISNQMDQDCLTQVNNLRDTLFIIHEDFNMRVSHDINPSFLSKRFWSYLEYWSTIKQLNNLQKRLEDIQSKCFRDVIEYYKVLAEQCTNSAKKNEAGQDILMANLTSISSLKSNFMNVSNEVERIYNTTKKSKTANCLIEQALQNNKILVSLVGDDNGFIRKLLDDSRNTIINNMVPYCEKYKDIQKETGENGKGPEGKPEQTIVSETIETGEIVSEKRIGLAEVLKGLPPKKTEAGHNLKGSPNISKNTHNISLGC